MQRKSIPGVQKRPLAVFSGLQPLFSGMKAAAIFVLVIGVMAGSTVAHSQDDTDEQPPSLYERLGGLAPISMVVSDFVDLLVDDDILNANPAIDAARQHTPAPYLKYHVTALMCQASGGPCQYHGREMLESHAHLNITEAEWDRMLEIFLDVLGSYDVPEGETQELLDIVGTTKSDIVTSDSG